MNTDKQVKEPEKTEHPEPPACRVEKPRYDYDIDLSDENRSHTLILKQVRKRQRVLEIGCATGYMTRFMKETLDCSIIAIEMDETAASKAKPFCDNLIVGDIESISLQDHFSEGQFDVIVMADVLEHLKDGPRVIGKLKPLLKDEGYMMLSIPNGAHGSLALDLLDGKWEYRDTGLMDRTHLHFFDKDSIARTLDAAGLFVAQLDRVVIHPRDTEMKTPWDSYPREVTAYIEKVNPEYQTYQFVIKAHPMSAAGWRKGLEDALAAEQSQISLLKERLAAKRSDRKRIEGLENELKKREAEYLASLDREIARLEAEKEGIHRSYRQEMAQLEAEKEGIHRSYRQEMAQLEEEKAQIHAGYQEEMDRAGRRERKLYHRLRVTEHELSKLQSDHETVAREYGDLQYELDIIRNSISWRMLERYRRILDRFLPPETRRRRLYRLATLAPFVLFHEGPAIFFKKIARRVVPWKTDDQKGKEGEGGPSNFTALSFPATDSVTVSIVIPVFNQAAHTHRCLVSLLEHTEGAFEVIVVDNASTDATASMLASVQGIRVIVNTKNLGFVLACNQGAAKASGDFIVFLNNDTEVTSGWLQALLLPFEDHDVGIVGAKLVYPDGRLQEAGNMIWQDGSGWNYGRGDDPERPEYNFIREVDYCSGACLAIPRTIWDTVGGFDERYVPAYYEDTDLCFAVREHGYKVVYQPFARVTHYEGMTAGTDVTTGYKRFQNINRKKFIDKWGRVLANGHREGPEHIYVARERGHRKRALIVDHYPPEFDKDSGSLRMFRLIGIFQQLGFKVVFWPENRAYHSRYTTHLQQMGVEAMYGPVSFTDYMKAHGPQFDLILLSRPHVAVETIDAARAYSDAMLIYDTVDLHCLRETRRAEFESDDGCRMAAQACAEDWREKELYLARTADVTLVVSPVEKELLEKENGLRGRIAVLSNIHDVQPPATGFAERRDIMFIGGFSHLPNEDGICWFVESIFPIILAQLPDIHLFIVGSNPTENVLGLASKQVTVTGYVPDVNPYFENARVFISPLRYGAGVKGKIGQSLSLGLPVVTTPIGAEGMGLVDDETALITADETDFAKKVLRLYRDPSLWERLSKKGQQTIENRFSKDVAKQALEQLLREHGLNADN